MSDHTSHLRRAVDDLRRGMEGLGCNGTDSFACDVGNDSSCHQLIQSARSASRKCREERENALQEVHRRLDADCNRSPIDTVHVQNDGSSWHVIDSDTTRNIYQFKQRYCARNAPCLVRGLDASYFADVSAQWRSAGNTSGDGKGEDAIERIDTTTINTEWFRQNVGDGTMVPVRIDTNEAGVQGGLDDEGRAQECDTVQMKMSEWIMQCKHQSDSDGHDDASMQRRYYYYLKDWHLVQYLSEKQSAAMPLYKTPTIFERDILNNFLTKYGGGDYKFAYWGPKGSQTRLHSDVLHSFSWSYNVVGRKQWTFHVPPSYNETSNHANDTKSFEVIQHSGEAIFVPATWKHEVVNLVETISINHNWVTSANIDLTWHCLLVEMVAIETEANEWGFSEDDYEARENMLRGCVGLDASMFVLMVLLEMAKLLSMVLHASSCDNCDGTLWDQAYSLFRLESVLRDLMDEPCLVRRLEAMLESQALAADVMKWANDAIEYVSRLTQST